MYRDRSVSLNHIIRDIKCYAGDENRIKEILLRVPCVDVNQYGKYIVRIDRFAITYNDLNGTYVYPIRYDSYCEDPGADNVITIVEDETCLIDPYIRTSIGQKSITEHIKRYPSTEDVEPFWMSVNIKQDSFTPRDASSPILYYRLTVAEDINL